MKLEKVARVCKGPCHSLSTQKVNPALTYARVASFILVGSWSPPLSWFNLESGIPGVTLRAGVDGSREVLNVVV